MKKRISDFFYENRQNLYGFGQNKLFGRTVNKKNHPTEPFANEGKNIRFESQQMISLGVFYLSVANANGSAICGSESEF